MKDAILIGCGGHAKVVGDVVLNEKRYALVGCVAGTQGEQGVLGLPVLGTDTELTKLYAQGLRVAYLGIGSNQIRQRLFNILQEIGFEIPAAVSSQSYLASGVQVGVGTLVMAGAVIQPDTHLGVGVIINTGVSVDHDCHIADFTHIAPGCNLAGNVTVEEGAFLGIGTKVIQGRRIGAWSTVGAGSVVIRDIPSRITAVGIPCRAIEKS